MISLIIPAYNEVNGIEASLNEVKKVLDEIKVPSEIIVVDDGSTDGTYDKVKGLGVKVIRNETNRGYGYSLKHGIRESKYDWICITDADGTYPAEEIKNLWKEAENYDMVVGARTGNKVHIPLIRKPAKWLIGKLANFLTEVKIPDLNSGLRLMRKEMVLKYMNILPSGFSFTLTITMAALTNDYRVKYIPIDYLKRVGSSKIRPIKDTLNFLTLLVRTSLYFNPMKIFMPLSLFLFLFSFILLGRDIFWEQNIGDKTVLLFSVSFLVTILGFISDLLVRKLPN